MTKSNVENKVTHLTNKVDLLEEKLDEQESYERRDTLIICDKKSPSLRLTRIALH